MSIKIIQASAPRTGSTVLANCLTEMFDKGKPVALSHKRVSKINTVTKTHNLNLDFWKKKYALLNKQKKLFFFVNHRDDRKKINRKYESWDNVVVFNYSEILETDSWSLNQICTNVYKKVSSKIPNIKEDCILDMEERIKKMNFFYESIKDKPFSYYDKYFSIHGSHRSK